MGPLWSRFDGLAPGSGGAAAAFRAEVFIDVGPVNAIAPPMVRNGLAALIRHQKLRMPYVSPPGELFVRCSCQHQGIIRR